MWTVERVRPPLSKVSQPQDLQPEHHPAPGRSPASRRVVRPSLAIGCQDMELLGEILHYLVTRYRNRGFDVPSDTLEQPPPVMFVGDIVLANIHYKLGWRVDRLRLRDVMNQECRDFVASYEPLVNDVSVSDGFPSPLSGRRKP